ncbi:MAG: hypothetical protein IKC90_02720 [Akkermansia sp.]|nr:hypothetical protein [Akkermansia sp.]
MKNTILSVLAFAGLSAGTTSAKMNDNCVPYVATDPFAVQMFSTLAKEHKGNFVFSPAGVEAVLRLLQQGARGTTAAELNALPMGKTGIKSAMNPAEADALFLADDFKLKAGIKADRIMRVPFATDATAAAKDINAWANENTRGLIPSVISAKDIDPRTRMVAANAIYLKEKWLHPFKKRATRENADFTMSNGTTTKVSMMYNKDKFHYAEGEDWQAVAMYYDYGEEGSNGEPGCFIGILPKGNAKEFACTLTPHKYQTIRTALANTVPQDTIIRMPRFELDPGTFSLIPALKACGLSKVFTPAADFSGFSDEPLYLSDMIQRCYVKADEEGTEAAAVTMAIMVQGCAAPSPNMPKEITFDRPFIWVITDLNTAAAPYFMGITEKP